MMPQLTLSGGIHTALALFCIAIGAIQFARPKRGASHRARGYVFVYAMLVADGAAMLVYRFTGIFNMFHVGALVNFASVIAAIVPMLWTPRPRGWKIRHYYFISWAYVGLMAAASNELIVRAAAVAGRAQVWGVSAVVTVLVTAIGYVLIERHRPPPEAVSGTDRPIIAEERIAS